MKVFLLLKNYSLLGFEMAYESLKRSLGVTVKTILAIPTEISESQDKNVGFFIVFFICLFVI